jgi:hypothetical protein
MGKKGLKDLPLFVGSPKDKAIISPKDKAHNRLHLKNINNLVLPNRLIISFFKDLEKFIAASFFSIGEFRNVDLAGIFIAGDDISKGSWNSIKTPDIIEVVKESRKKLLDLAIEVLK